MSNRRQFITLLSGAAAAAFMKWPTTTPSASTSDQAD